MPKRILYIDSWPNVEALDICSHGLGASLFKLAAVADAAQDGYQCDWLTSPVKAQLLKGAYGIHTLYTDIKEVDFADYQKVIFLGVPEEQINAHLYGLTEFIPFTTADRTNYKTTAHLKFWRQFNACVLGKSEPATPAKVTLQLEEQALNDAEVILHDDCRWVAISTQVISPLKDFENWQLVINQLIDDGYGIVLLGHEELPGIKHDRVINLTGKTDIQLLKAIIARVDAFAGSDGLATNLSMFLRTPTVVLFTVIDPQHVIDPDQNLRSPVIPLVKKGCPLQFCYPQIHNYRSAGCLYNLQHNSDQPIQCVQFDSVEISKTIKSLLSE
jgi:hypothetical protein